MCFVWRMKRFKFFGQSNAGGGELFPFDKAPEVRGIYVLRPRQVEVAGGRLEAVQAVGGQRLTGGRHQPEAFA